MAKSTREPRFEFSLPDEARYSYDRIILYGIFAGAHLYESWQRPKRHNRRIERAALWATLMLDRECGRVLDDKALMLPPWVDLDTRYELQAGVRTVHQIIPFSTPERDALRATDMIRDYEFRSEKVANREPALVERWHRWLWMDEHNAPQTNAEALGASAILAEGCERLRESAREVLGR